MEYHFDVQGPTVFPRHTYSEFPEMGVPDTVGSVARSDLKIDYAPEGTFYMRAFATEEGADTCYS